MEGKITLGEAGPDDSRALLELQELSPGTAVWSEPDYRSLLTQESTICLLAKDSAAQRRVGFLLARVMADEVEILNLAVAAACRRRGIARSLIEETLNRACARGARQCWLEVRASNQAARVFYQALGFEEHSRRPGYYRNPIEDALIYRRRVEASGSPVLPSRRGD